MAFDGFTPEHARDLQAALDAPDWQEVCRDGTVDAARRDTRTPPKVANVFALPVAQLRAVNEPRVRALIDAGERDEERLLAVLGTWPSTWPADLPVRLSFLGLSLSFACDMQPPCVYCNQRPVAECMSVEDWKTALRSLPCGRGRPLADGEGVYVYFTGGEPLLLGEDLWGPEGLIQVAGDAGAACNVNTNALQLTPRAALGFVSSGLGRLHLSLDTHRAEVADSLYQQAGRWQQVMRGLFNVQIAKALLGVAHPVIHLNCVLTRLNADDFPAFLQFILNMKPLLPEGLSSDLDFHLIPVGGEQNRGLRLTAEGYERFFSETWGAADEVWQAYQEQRSVAPDKRKTLQAAMPFLSPYHRVTQRGELSEWAQRAGEGRPSDLALSRRCYVAPTQGFLLPNGTQYWCGGHAIARPEPVGSILEHDLVENIRRALPQVAELPAPHCRNCPGATLAINQTVENRLRQAIQEWLNPEQAPAAAADEPQDPTE
jgi:MoaA/NifB/PqqE/SkfB family radical SAM enzyme